MENNPQRIDDPDKAEAMARASGVKHSDEIRFRDMLEKNNKSSDPNFYHAEKQDYAMREARHGAETAEVAAGIIYELQNYADTLYDQEVEKLKDLLDEVKSRNLPIE